MTKGNLSNRKIEELGPLAGVVVGVKDNLCTLDMPSIIVGKINLDEFGMGSTTENSAFQGIATSCCVLLLPDMHMLGSSLCLAFGVNKHPLFPSELLCFIAADTTLGVLGF
ncbi:hypothetical protein NE237_014808 [Protea cynaroides]|uniref:Uncharacterized protein n=1 Tax=Protea cynaroides TaxID=273540 RepID=A0A9Q0KCV9_9MAGN|nr:hypothetical protein NE237_014808 [Protea cynaroides]